MQTADGLVCGKGEHRAGLPKLSIDHQTWLERCAAVPAPLAAAGSADAGELEAVRCCSGCSNAAADAAALGCGAPPASSAALDGPMAAWAPEAVAEPVGAGVVPSGAWLGGSARASAEASAAEGWLGAGVASGAGLTVGLAGSRGMKSSDVDAAGWVLGGASTGAASCTPGAGRRGLLQHDVRAPGSKLVLSLVSGLHFSV